MSQIQPEQPHIIFLFSDTGGGHRSACEAVIEAIQSAHPGEIFTEMLDLFKEYAPPPFDRAPEIYPPLSRMPDLWELGYRVSDGKERTRFFSNVVWPYIRRYIHRLVEENPCDLLVSVHPLMNAPVLRALGKHQMPFVTIVTDMVSTHAFWYDRRATSVIVPTDAAKQRALGMGLLDSQVQVIGLPVAERFCQPLGDCGEIRKRLGWSTDLPVVLLVGGGEGMGPLERTANAINSARLPVQLVIVSGRNRRLKTRLEKKFWSIPVTVYGFVREMPDFMRASNVLVTKAGPGTISEAFIAGLPMILYSRMPGQEDGNVTYVVEQGAGIWAPEPEGVVDALRRWLAHPDERDIAAEACSRLARPCAASEIAEILVRLAEKSANPVS